MDIRKFFSATGPAPVKRAAEDTKKQSDEKTKPKQSTKAVKEPAKPKASEKEEKKAAPVEASKRERNEPAKPASTKEKKESGKKPRQRIVMLDSDSDDEEPIPKKAKKQAKECKAAAVDSDEESEEPIVSKKPTDRTQAAVSKDAPPKKPATKVNGKEPPKQKLVPVSADDFFASASISPASKLSLKAAQAKKVSTAKESHEDDDFQKTLEKLDEKTEEKKLTIRSSPRKTTKDPESSMAKKLSPSKGSAAQKPEHSKKPEKEKAAAKHSPEIRRAELPAPASQSSKKPDKKPTPKKESPKKVPEKTERVTPGKQAAKKEKPAPAKEKVPKEEKPAAATVPAFRRGNAASYQSYLNREGPRLLGTRDIPEGAPGCLKGVTLVVTGVLECIERDDAKELLERCGAKVTQSVSRNTTYVVAGRDSGPAKIRKAEECKVEIIDEDALYELIESRSGGDGKRKAKEAEVKEEPEEASTPKKKRKVDPDDSSEEHWVKGSPRVGESVISPTKKSKDTSTTETPSTSCSQKSWTPAEMWVDKYKPQTTKQIIGQQGDKSNCGKLLLWLRNWHKSRAGPKKPIPKWGGGGGDGSAFKAALLSGAPGIGKTTTATLAAREAGYSILEMNASDTRSKKSLAEHVAETLRNRTFTGSGTTSKHVLIMDEVDGMAGNEDRGGVQEMIALIKSTRIPIICICNDRSHPKMRSLVNYCFDLRFQRPQVKQIQAALMSIACKEGLSITPAVVQEIVMASNQDVRQALHNLSLWSSRTKTMSVSQVKADAGKGTKDIKMGPFEVVRKILSSTEGGQSMTLNEKAALFFHDYNMVPLFVQDNYLHVQPLEAKGDRQKHLRLVSEAADCISYGDLVERQIRQHGSWSLLPMQAFFSSVIPGELVRGHMREMITFPAWFGKNSSTTKRHRLLRELKHHTHTRVSADRTQLSMDYVGPLLDSLTRPLIDKGADGVPSVVRRMHHYYLQRADLDNLCDLALWPGMKDPMANIDSKVKAALTRTLNKEAFMTPYSTEDIVKKKAKKGAGKSEKLAASQDDEENAEEEEEEAEPDPTLVDYE
ncbi:replication factor C subunit 1 [Rhipicephalus sanguineus]|uniref:replication factor C subunit 1 n=1 Tax=Rhipicephalus sanguineus TaxID=34632 RepID=UPI001893A618|nr:replication factor C subunit 1 [Rhipicephalus sanguineus]